MWRNPHFFNILFLQLKYILYLCTVKCGTSLTQGCGVRCVEKSYHPFSTVTDMTISTAADTADNRKLRHL